MIGPDLLFEWRISGVYLADEKNVFWLVPVFISFAIGRICPLTTAD